MKIFPKLTLTGDSRSYYPLLTSSEMETRKRIASPVHFSTYYRYVIQENRIPDKEIQQFIVDAEDETNLYEQCRSLSANRKAQQLVRQLRAHDWQNVSQSVIKNIFSFLLLPDPEFAANVETFDAENLAEQLLNKMSAGESFKLLSEALSNPQVQMDLVANLIHHLDYQLTRSQNSQLGEVTPIDPDDLETLKNQYCNLVESLAYGDQLANHPSYAYLFEAWQAWAPDAKEEYVDRLLSEDEGIIKVLEVSLAEYVNLSDPERSIEWRFSWDIFNLFIPPEKREDKLPAFVNQVRAIKDSLEFEKLSVEEQRAIELFLDVVKPMGLDNEDNEATE